jgi:hypothetical protein
MSNKKDTYVELEVGNYGLTIEKLQDFIDRAKASGLTEVDCDITMGYYDDIEGVTIRATLKS